MAAEKGIFMQEQAGTRMKEAEVGGGWCGVGGPRVLGEDYSPEGMTVLGNRKVGCRSQVWGLRKDQDS